MTLTLQEVDHLLKLLRSTDGWKIAKSEQVDLVGISHSDLIRRLEDYRVRLALL